jgi:hypothetical protein
LHPLIEPGLICHLHLDHKLSAGLIGCPNVKNGRFLPGDTWEQVRIGDGNTDYPVISLQLQRSIQKRNERSSFLLIAEYLAERDVVFYVCELHQTNVSAKIRESEKKRKL